MNWKMIWEIFRDAGKQWLDNKAPRMGAALAYYSAFSLAPLVLLCIAIGGLVLGNDKAVQDYAVGQVREFVGDKGGEALSDMIQSSQDKTGGIVATVIGVAILIFGASAVFNELQDSLDTIWMVKPKPDRGVWGVVKDRFMSFSMVMGCCFLLLVSLVVSAVLSALTKMFGDAQSVLGQFVNFAISFSVITVLFAMIYRFLPDATIAWRNVWLGASVTSLMFGLGKLGIGLYLAHTATASSFGAAGSLAVLLIWLYYSAQIFLYGAELTKVFTDRFGGGAKPTENAQHISADGLAKQGISMPKGENVGAAS